jgi:type I restriction enzyme S subunit
VSGWHTVALSEIAAIGAGNSAPQDPKLFQDGTVPFIRTSDVGRVRFGHIEHAEDLLNSGGQRGLRLWPPTTILFPKSGASTFLNHRVMMDVEAYVASHLATIVAKPDRVLPAYLLYFLHTIRAQDLTQDHNYPSLRLPEIGAIKVPLPPLAEQKRIVAILDVAFEAIARATANAERNVVNAQEMFAGICHALISRIAPDAEKLSLEKLLERKWIVGHLDGNHGSEYPRKEEFVSHGVPYISANAIDDDAVDMGAAKYLAPERAARIRKGVAQDGDVLFAHNATVGPVAVLNTAEPKVILGTSLTFYRCNSKRIDNRYLAHYMRSHLFTSQYNQVMRQSTRNQVPITKQREFFHVIPRLEVQREISQRLDALEESSRNLRRLCTEKILRLAELRQSLLHKAFSGQLTGKEAVAA